MKPAMDESGMVMIQLHKTSSRNANNPNNVFVVELVYIEIQVLFFFLIPPFAPFPSFSLPPLCPPSLSLCSSLMYSKRTNQWSSQDLSTLASRCWTFPSTTCSSPSGYPLYVFFSFFFLLFAFLFIVFHSFFLFLLILFSHTNRIMNMRTSLED